MQTYKAYLVSASGHILGPPTILICDSDDRAIEHATPLVDGHDMELWQGARLVRKLSADKSGTG